MSNQSGSHAGSDPLMTYQIRVEGHLDSQWEAWFVGATLTPEAGGYTLLTCPVVDQAALYGLLKKVRDLGVPLISVIRISHTSR